MVPLFGPVPGGAELIIIFLIGLLMFGLPLVLLGGGFVLYQRSKSGGTGDEELRALRREVEALREEIKQLDDDENR